MLNYPKIGMWVEKENREKCKVFRGVVAGKTAQKLSEQS